MGELHDLTALEQGAAVARGEVSPRELTDHYLDRAQRLSDDVGAFVTLTPEVAREQADRLAAELRDTGDGAAVPARRCTACRCR